MCERKLGFAFSLFFRRIIVVNVQREGEVGNGYLSNSV